jgi:protein O-mannosyl-transferase
MLAYLEFDARRRPAAYALSIGLFALALFSKTVTASLPLALLVVFWWQRGAIAWRKDVLPLVPFVVIGAAGGLTTAWIERVLLGARGAEFDFSFVERGLIAGRAFWFYLAKLAWPTDLMFIYPRWEISDRAWSQYLYPIGALALLAAAWTVRKRTRAPLAALLLFGGTLLPVLGFLNVYPFRFSFVADHFQYLASLVPIVVFSAAVVTIGSRWKLRPAVVSGVAAVVLGCVLAPLTWAQSHQYANAETLYRTTIRANPSCWLAHVNLGILMVPDRPEEAEASFYEALRLKADLPEAHYNLGIIFHRRGQLGPAERYYRDALRLSPKLAEAHNNLGDVLRRTERVAEAIQSGERAIRLAPDSAETRYTLGLALREAGRLTEAVTQFGEAKRLGLEGAELEYYLGASLHQAGRVGESIAHYAEAIRLKPDYPEAHANLGAALDTLGRADEAMAHYREALRVNPGYADAYYYLGNGLMRMNRAEEAIEQYSAALRLNPKDAAVHNNLGLALESVGRRADAAQEYRIAVQLRPDLAEAAANLARVTGTAPRQTR